MIIRIKPQDAPDFFDQYEDRLRRERFILAENGYGTQISLTADDMGQAVVKVTNNGFLVSTFATDDPDLLVEKLSMLFDMFLGKGWELEEEEEPAELAEMDDAYERCDAVRMAFYDFLSIAVEDEELVYGEDLNSDLESMLMDVLQEISDLGLPVRFPIVTDNGDGTYQVDDYPFERAPS